MMPKTQPHVYIVSVENSGDQLGASLISALRQGHPKVQISGIGGPAMTSAGVPSDMAIEGLSILGFSEAVRAYPLVLRRVKTAVNLILNAKPDCVVLIDSWGFMIRLAQRLKQRGFRGKIIKYVAPQVFAMREGRAKVLAKHVDHLLSIHDFDAHYFTEYGLAVTHVGNPMFDTDYDSGSAQALYERTGISAGHKICAVFFGSRMSELNQLYAPLTHAISILSRDYPDMVFISPISDGLHEAFAERKKSEEMKPLICVPESAKYDLFAAAHVAIACSGTVTTQIASVGIPAVVAYRLKPLTWFFASRLFKQNHVSLINISAGAPLMSERLQNEATGENIAADISILLDDRKHHAKISKALKRQADVMRGVGGSASKSAAARILELIA